MATITEENESRKNLKEALDKLSATDADSLARTAELGTALGFQDIKEDIERILELFVQLKNISLDGVARTTMETLLGQANDALSKFEQIRNFKPNEHEKPNQIRDTYATQIRDAYDTYFNHAYPIIAYGRARGEDLKGLQRQAQEIVNSIEKLKKDFEKKHSEVTSELDTVLGQVRDSAGKIGVAKYASQFQKEAEDHEKKAVSWLKGTIGLTILTIVWGFLTFKIHPEGGYTAWLQLFQYTVPKLIILSVLLFALVWAAKNYQAHRHNYVINKHRQNSLSTFEAFVAAAGDDADTKNAVLLQATQSIFSAQSTGYTSAMHAADAPQRVVEIFRSVGDTTKSG